MGSTPKSIADSYIERAVEQRREWIEKAIAKFNKLTAGLKLEKESVDRRVFTREVVELVKHRAEVMGVKVRKVSVRKMKSRWGSCSKEGNISINLLFGHLPDDLLDYVIIHELCHIVHHNHSKSFWSLVASYLPDFKLRKSQLRRYGYLLRQPSPKS